MNVVFSFELPNEGHGWIFLIIKAMQIDITSFYHVIYE